MFRIKSYITLVIIIVIKGIYIFDVKERMTKSQYIFFDNDSYNEK